MDTLEFEDQIDDLNVLPEIFLLDEKTGKVYEPKVLRGFRKIWIVKGKEVANDYRH